MKLLRLNIQKEALINFFSLKINKLKRADHLGSCIILRGKGAKSAKSFALFALHAFCVLCSFVASGVTVNLLREELFSKPSFSTSVHGKGQQHHCSSALGKLLEFVEY